VQQTFTCPKCGVQNLIGYQFCGSCGAAMFGGTQHYEWPPLHILALDQKSKFILGFKLRRGSTVISPALTADGRLSTVPVGDVAQFRDFQKHVRNDIMRKYANCQTHFCFGLSLIVEQNPKFNDPAVLPIWNVSGSTQKFPEMDYFHDSLSRLNMFPDPYWDELEQFFKREPQKSWINNLIANLKRGHDYDDYVATALSQLGFDYSGHWTDEVVVVGELERF